MMHDELLAYINKEIDQAAWTKEYYPFKSLQSLRAVVELHKPVFNDYFAYYDNEGCFACNEIWPCYTIQVIQKELND